MSKVAFITGANRGIGFETARELAEQSVFVVIGSRDADQGKIAAQKLREKGYQADSLKFDVTNVADHKAAFEYFQKKFDKLDILVNNAAIMIDAEDASAERVNKTSTTSEGDLRKTFDVNFFGPITLTQTLLPLIRKSKAGRIVNLSSSLSSLTLHTDPSSPIYEAKLFSYDVSKTALNAYTVHLAHELKSTKIKVNAAHPGWVKTRMGGASAMLEPKDGGKTSVQLALLPEDGPTGGLFHLGEQMPW